MDTPFLLGEDAIPFPTPPLLAPDGVEIEREAGAGVVGRTATVGAGGFEALRRCKVLMGNFVLYDVLGNIAFLPSY